MTDNVSVPRSRRALLAAAAGGAAALAASAAVPLTTMADDSHAVVKEINNATFGTTGITNSKPNTTAFTAAATDGIGFGLDGSSSGSAGIVGWSTSAPTTDPAILSYTGIYGWAPAAPVDTQVGVGVLGESDDWGVLGLGTVGVYGLGTFGVIGESQSTAAGVVALASSNTDLALDVYGKVRFSRSGRTSVGAGKSTRIVNLAGVSSSSRVFALIHSNRSGRWVRAVVPTTGSFKIYLNGTVSSSTYVAWFVLN